MHNIYTYKYRETTKNHFVMATENTTLHAQDEQVNTAQGAVVEDAQNTQQASNVAEEPAATPKQAETSEPGDAMSSTIDFSEEQAALDAQSAGLDLGDETPEERAQSNDPLTSDNEYAGKSCDELVEIFAETLSKESVHTLRRDVEAIKIAFYKRRRADLDLARRTFIEQGGQESEFVVETDTAESRLKDLFKEYRRRRDEYISNLENEKEGNYQAKLKIIDELKELINSDETLNHTFNKFRDLQHRWRDAGSVPQQHIKDLWETYNLHVENFYSFIKINKELRDLDLKKNYEIKTTLCEQAEALLLEPSIVEAFHKLQKLHEEWRETGPVANEYKEPLWERFRDASSRINKQHQEHFETLKSDQVKNLALKSQLCETMEELVGQPYTTRREWNKASEKLLEIQKTWKTIGFAPKKDNNRIYERFRAACDRFFESKRDFYASLKTEMEHNLHVKSELCEAAEALSNSDDWKKATDEFISLQARWKEIGPVSRRHSDAIWKRFRAACDKFFERKSSHFAGVDSEYEGNLARKTELLDEMAATNIKEGGFDAIKAFQRRWSEIGFVPIKHKDSIQKRYKKVVDDLFATLRGTERERSMNRFKDKVASIRTTGNSRMRTERDRLYNKVRQLEQEIALLENNIGFFSKSKGADALIAEVKSKIERTRTEIADTIEKVKLLDTEMSNEATKNSDN